MSEATLFSKEDTVKQNADSVEFSHIEDVPADAKQAIVGGVQCKRCSRCGKMKPLDGFNKGNDSFRRRYECKSCLSEINARPESKAYRREFYREWRKNPKNKAKQREFHKAWRERPKNKTKSRERQMKWESLPENKEKRKEWASLPENKARLRELQWKGHLKRSYGISVEDRDSKIAEQGGICPICLGVPTCVDHNHETGEFRGVLCRKCNSGLGKFGDDPETMRLAIAYLETRGNYSEWLKSRNKSAAKPATDLKIAA